jgi:hypothetical protein
MSHSIAGLVNEGRLKIGTELFHPGRRASTLVEARVVANGIEVGGVTYRSASSAAKAVSGHAVNGWRYWRVRPSGAYLDEMRKQ